MTDFKPLSSEKQADVEKTTAIIKAASVTIPCTACGYCIDGCPKKIAIPDYFAVYNNLKRFGGLQGMVAVICYGNLNRSNGKASDIIGCGKCESTCSRHLLIRNYLKDMAATFEE